MESISVLCHLFYQDTFAIIKPYLQNLLPYNTRFYFNLCIETSYCHVLAATIKKDFSDAIITISPNTGKDIGGKLVLIDTYLKLQQPSNFLILLHDKMSPHTSTGVAWREKLFSILEPNNIQQILKNFKNEKGVGIVGSSRTIMNEYNKAAKTYTCTSNQILMDLRDTYQIKSQKHQFIAGTMFWVRSNIYEQFFSKHQPLAIRSTLETGNIHDQQNGTFAHAWERMFSWIAFQQGFQLKGV